MFICRVLRYLTVEWRMKGLFGHSAALILNSILVAYSSAQTLSIHDIQYTTDPSGDSPYVGQIVNTGGIVTATDFVGMPIRHFISDRFGGSWSGVFLFDNQDRDFNIGDSVSFLAEVQESAGQTRLRSIVNGSFVRVVDSIDVPPRILYTADVLEPVEGVLIEMHGVVVVSVNLDDSTFVVCDGMGCASVGRGWNIPYRPYVGDTLNLLRGIVSYSDAQFVVNPRDEMDIAISANRLPVDDLVISIDESYLQFNWGNASFQSYRLYSDEAPNGAFTTLEGSTADTFFSIFGGAASERRYYYVAGSTTP